MEDRSGFAVSPVRRDARTVGAFVRLPLASIAAVVIGVAYLAWRLLATRSGTSPVLFALLFVAEAFGVARLAVELLLVGRRSDAQDRLPNSIGSAAMPASCAVFLLTRDEPLPVVRASLLAASHVARVASIELIDLDARYGVAGLAQRLGVGYSAVELGRGPAGLANLLLERCAADCVVVVSAEAALLPDAIEVLASRLAHGVAAVSGATATANAIRRVDRTGMGDAEVWKNCSQPRLARVGALPSWGGVVLLRRDALVACGGFASADHLTLTNTASRLRSIGATVASTSEVVARRLAPGSVSVAQHRYARDLHQRLRRLVVGPRQSLRTLGGVAEWSALVAPLRAVQRVALLVVVWAVLLSSAVPIDAPGTVLLAAFSARVVAGVVARYLATRGRGFEPWLLNDLRVLPADLAVGARTFDGDWNPPPRAARPPGGGVLRFLPRALQGFTSLTIMAVASGFVRVAPGARGLVAVAGGVVFLTASNLARRELRRTQFRLWHRADVDLVAVDDPTIRVVGLSPFGFDVLCPAPILVGSSFGVVAVVAHPIVGSIEVRLRGRVQRAGAVDEGWAAYVKFDGIDDATEDAVLEFLAATSYTGRPINDVVRTTFDGKSQ
jgi:hypothetical protein